MDSFLRLVAVAHANGLQVYPDIVLDHCAGGDSDPSSFQMLMPGSAPIATLSGTADPLLPLTIYRRCLR